jgi:GntR family transcriptional regulator
MKIQIGSHSPLGIKEQIKRQLRLWIQSGELEAGSELPSSRDLAQILKVNRNTTWAAYKDLAAEGWLICSRGRATKVAEGKRLPGQERLAALLDEALIKARDLGYDQEAAREFFLDYLGTQGGMACGAKVLVLECNLPAAAKIARALEQEAGASTTQMLLQDLESNPARITGLTSGFDLVVCGYNHLNEVRQLFEGQPVQLGAVLFSLDLAIIKELASLPAGSSTGFVCLHQRAAKALFNDSLFSAGRKLTRLIVGADDHEALGEMLAECNLVYATELVYQKVAGLAGPRHRVVKVDLNVDSHSVEVIKQLIKQGKEAAE